MVWKRSFFKTNRYNGYRGKEALYFEKLKNSFLLEECTKGQKEIRKILYGDTTQNRDNHFDRSIQKV